MIFSIQNLYNDGYVVDNNNRLLTFVFNIIMAKSYNLYDIYIYLYLEITYLYIILFYYNYLYILYSKNAKNYL